MNPSLVQELIADRPPTLRILYGVATANNTVLVAGSTVAVELPALEPVVSGDYCAVLATGADRLILGSMATAWTAVSFSNSWVNYGSGFQEAEYRKVGDMVQLRGNIKGGTLDAAGFTLPVGFRPPATVAGPGNGAGTFLIACALEIGSDGVVTILATNAALVSYVFSFSVTA